ncbi:MAG: hypothetical protein NXI14_14030 [bacterium]|nr:hypothetical protein [bacterium]
MKSTRTTILVSLMVIMSAMLVTVHPVAPAHAATSTVSVAGVATVGPVPADPVPHDPACYNACWQQLQDDLDNASDTIDDLRDQADAADDEAAGYEACADAALEDYIDCRASAEFPSTCDHYFDTFTDCARTAADLRATARALRAVADWIEDTIYDSYADCLSACDGDPV